MSFIPIVCPPGGGGGGGSGLQADVENLILCDVGPDGEILGTALAVYEYDVDGNPVGAPTFVDPITNAPYVPVGILQPCPGDTACMSPVQFCFSSTAPVDQPGRMYDLSFDLGIGFPVQAIVKDLVETPVNITWEVTDPTAANFMSSLETALQSQFSGATVDVTAGALDPCTGVATFNVHIECLRLDQNPPALLQLKYNGGRDAIQNAAFNGTPPTSNAGAGGEFYERQDDPTPGVAPTGVFGQLDCTNVANRGWETNDRYGTFETWGPPGSTKNILAGTTPTPRGTSVQEINSWGSGPPMGPYGDNPNTIWQTFSIPAGGNFRVKVVVGGRASAENIGIKLSAGDVDDLGIGDIINTSVLAPQVTDESPTGIDDHSGGPAGPWTTFDQTVPLAAGTYTLAFTGPNLPDGDPGAGNAFGGLFTDMRVYQDAPNQLGVFANDDVTCVVPTTETSVVCEYWTPICGGGEITGWRNTADGELLSNAEFWSQVPAPTCCETTPGGGSGSSGNLISFYDVCGVVGGVPTNLERVVITDQAGGIIAETFVGPGGGPVTPTSWTIGPCFFRVNTEDTRVLCDDNGQFLRTFVHNAEGVLIASSDSDVRFGLPYTTVGQISSCPPSDREVVILCDDNGPFLREYFWFEQGGFGDSNDFLLDHSTLYNPVGTIHVCPTVDEPIDVNIVPDPIVLDSTIQRQQGAGNITIPAGARSITLVVTAGTADVQIAADPVITVTQGVTLTWAVDDRDESLTNAHSFTGIAGSDFLVVTTRV